jgi:hypothetical protein
MNEGRGPPGTHPCWIAQNIGVAWVCVTYEPQRAPGERHFLKVLCHFEDGEGLDYRLRDLTLPNGPALRFIDSVGNTFFNEHQTAAFVEELQEIRSRCNEPDLASRIDALVAFARRKYPGDTQLWFIGD